MLVGRDGMFAVGAYGMALLADSTGAATNGVAVSVSIAGGRLLAKLMVESWLVVRAVSKANAISSAVWKRALGSLASALATIWASISETLGLMSRTDLGCTFTCWYISAVVSAA